MIPAARLSAAMEILDEIVEGAPAERVLTRWGRENRFAGSKDRAAIRDHVYDALRRRRSALWRSGAAAETGRALILGLLLETDPAALELLTGAGHAPAPPDADERAAFRCLDGAPPPVAGDYPDFLHDELARSLGPALPEVAAALKDRAPVDLRVNRLKAGDDAALAALAADGIAAAPVDGVPGALRVTGNPRRLTGGRAYRDGLVELQDAASQAVALLARPGPGEAVLDLCAGGGGKTLALAAAMGGQGRLVAFDANPRRMRDLPVRAGRAGARIRVAADAEVEALAPYDLVMVDAPCSGSGAWRRDPAQKWNLRPADLDRLAAVQAQVLARARAVVRPGGRIAYATCSLLAEENEDRVAAFLARNPGCAKGTERRWLPGAPGDGFYFCEIIVP
ncbi:RsmB/NOP family class I SAM-dependent RNA methyltransferase [Rhodobacteraceae bacterium 2CG4]|uniref:RsmB/NOP family class I SAM-dependent RNA methyltransferase n=1 Tax=Halovulum marinum TaxID=2662447 RepID=A0A6L5Z550_9RHOB|nr:RsmB/NOP family class I SAM-dependent RNA methyltransferase [Halovulum marinum]MSU91439.1 RsmB/NOP family class I SAM-dependent RNA methyltransferase [Halovulum marinum]